MEGVKQFSIIFLYKMFNGIETNFDIKVHNKFCKFSECVKYTTFFILFVRIIYSPLFWFQKNVFR